MRWGMHIESSSDWREENNNMEMMLRQGNGIIVFGGESWRESEKRQLITRQKLPNAGGQPPVAGRGRRGRVLIRRGSEWGVVWLGRVSGGGVAWCGEAGREGGAAEAQAVRRDSVSGGTRCPGGAERSCGRSSRCFGGVGARRGAAGAAGGSREGRAASGAPPTPHPAA